MTSESGRGKRRQRFCPVWKLGQFIWGFTLGQLIWGFTASISSGSA
jgi:hypothetical protein